MRRPAAGPGAAVRRVVLESAGLFDILADAGMLVLHSAYIVTRQGEGILFSGPSGIGKSTQAALWQRYGAAQTVNGDRALVRPDTGTVSGVMYAGTSGICRNVTAPLRAVVLLHQAPESRVTDIRPQEAFARVTENIRALRELGVGVKLNVSMTPYNVADLAAALRAEYDVDEPTALQDAQAFLDALRQLNIV